MCCACGSLLQSQSACLSQVTASAESRGCHGSQTWPVWYVRCSWDLLTHRSVLVSSNASRKYHPCSTRALNATRRRCVINACCLHRWVFFEHSPSCRTVTSGSSFQDFKTAAPKARVFPTTFNRLLIQVRATQRSAALTASDMRLHAKILLGSSRFGGGQTTEVKPRTTTLNTQFSVSHQSRQFIWLSIMATAALDLRLVQQGGNSSATTSARAITVVIRQRVLRFENIYEESFPRDGVPPETGICTTDPLPHVEESRTHAGYKLASMRDCCSWCSAIRVCSYQEKRKNNHIHCGQLLALSQT